MFLFQRENVTKGEFMRGAESFAENGHSLPEIRRNRKTWLLAIDCFQLLGGPLAAEIVTLFLVASETFSATNLPEKRDVIVGIDLLIYRATLFLNCSRRYRAVNWTGVAELAFSSFSSFRHFVSRHYSIYEGNVQFKNDVFGKINVMTTAMRVLIFFHREILCNS